jgi:urease accessory protein
MTATLRATLAFALLCASLSVAAHPGDAASHGLITGFTHPFEGLDHLLAMVAVGLWAARARGWSVWIAPAVFLSGMLAGGFAGIAGLVPPFVEAGVAGSTIALCVLVVIGLHHRDRLCGRLPRGDRVAARAGRGPGAPRGAENRAPWLFGGRGLIMMSLRCASTPFTR